MTHSAQSNFAAGFAGGVALNVIMLLTFLLIGFGHGPRCLERHSCWFVRNFPSLNSWEKVERIN